MEEYRVVYNGIKCCLSHVDNKNYFYRGYDEWILYTTKDYKNEELLLSNKFIYLDRNIYYLYVDNQIANELLNNSEKQK